MEHPARGRPSYACGPAAVPLLAETLGAALDRATAAHAAREAVVCRHQNVRATYADLGRDSDEFARGLLAVGVRRGDRVGIWALNSYEWVVAQFAAAKAGAILVNVNPAYRTWEAAYALRQSGVSVLLVQSRFKSSDYLAMLREIRGELAELRTIVLLGEDDIDAPMPDTMRWGDVIYAARNVDAEALAQRQAAVQFDDPVNIQYTSGTTGSPKGATLSHHNVLNNGFFVGEGCRLTERDRVCVPVPFYHCFGMVMGTIAVVTHGATLVVPSAAFDAAATMEAVTAERCTALYGVPTMFIAELALPDFASYDCSSLRTGIMAGSPCPVEIMKRVQSEMHVAEVTICYGMTETSPVSTQTAPDDPLETRTATVGRVHPHVEIKIVDEDGRVVPRGTSGELCTRGYGVMLGYWNDPESTARAIDAARYMHTGDIAIMDPAGYVAISGRSKDVVIRGGENVYPREIEEFLYRHPAVKDVAVIGVPDEKYGEELCAWIVLHEGHPEDAEAIRSFCRGSIAHYKVPRHVRFASEFPMTVTGKVQKYRMREISSAELGGAAQP